MPTSYHRADKACSRVEEVVGALQGGATAVKQGGDCGLDHAPQTARPAEGLLSAQHMAVVGPADCVPAGATSEHVPTGSLCHVPAPPACPSHACSRVEEVVGALQGGATAVKQGGDCGLDHASQP